MLIFWDRKAMAQTRYKQDMPPPGGYAKISIERILPRSYFKSPYMIGGSLLATLIMYKEYLKNRDRLRLWNLETNDVFVSLQPFLVAERDRAYLKHIRKNYEEEKLIMKDVPEWEVRNSILPYSITESTTSYKRGLCSAIKRICFPLIYLRDSNICVRFGYR